MKHLRSSIPYVVLLLMLLAVALFDSVFWAHHSRPIVVEVNAGEEIRDLREEY